MILVVSASLNRGRRVVARLAALGHDVDGPLIGARALFDHMEGLPLPDLVVLDCALSTDDSRKIGRFLKAIQVPMRVRPKSMPLAISPLWARSPRLRMSTAPRRASGAAVAGAEPRPLLQ